MSYFTLCAERGMVLRAEAISEADLPVRVQWINDPRVNKYMYFGFPVTIQSTTKWFQRVAAATDRHDLVFKDDAGEVVGMAGITGISETFFNGEFYIFINPEMHAGGIGPAITSWMLDYAFIGLQLHKVYLYVDSENSAALKLYDRLGFLQEGNLREHRKKGGHFHDKLVYGLLGREWFSIPWKMSGVEVVTPVAELAW